MVSGDHIFSSDIPAGRSLSLVIALVHSMIAENMLDTQKIYVGGLSMGGMGTYELLWREPDLFSAAIIISGAGDTAMAKKMRHNLPVWIFHGDADDVVKVENGRNIVHAMQEAKMNVRYSEYKDVNHNSWDKAFAEPQLLS